ncbi:hypothetical protein DF118_09775 [Burkholderia stagnalis]|nr:hypothetical protein DF163_28060 [Burkholderia stagnalis]RQQ31245.1 hypothetical protein DF149_16315 [Burkholderia stagnalis]RQX90853.1 hypothetical protein DF119_28290 [Burkholderia stagnalis]RQY14646.1 hypothetical protein DF118_09775 [Burkholderia stagnalis]RQY31379.1 hypothetical protein DF116_28910 [Burkholderia stagnalis]
MDWPRVIGQERYGLAAGCDATYVALRAPNAVAVAAAVAAVAAVAVAVAVAAVAVAAAAAAAAADASAPAERRVVRRGESDAGAQFTPGLRFAR